MKKEILIREIPCEIKLKELANNVTMSYRVMELIHEGKLEEAFEAARQILNFNNSIIERNVDVKEVMNILEKDKYKYN